MKYFPDYKNELSSNSDWIKTKYRFTRNLEQAFVDHLKTLAAKDAVLYFSDTVRVCFLKKISDDLFSTEGSWITTKTNRLADYFDSVGNEHRGYLLKSVKTSVSRTVEEVSDMAGFDGAVIYNCDPTEQFSAFTAKCKALETEAFLLGSQQFATATKLQDGESISYTVDGVRFDRVFKLDRSMKGTIALNPTFDMGLSASLLSSYRFSRLDFERAGK